MTSRPSIALRPLALRSLGCLAGLALYLLAGIADALALVGLRLTNLADVGGHLAHLFLVDALDADTGRYGHLEGDAVGGGNHDRMAETEAQLELPRPSGRRPIADADNLQLLS